MRPGLVSGCHLLALWFWLAAAAGGLAVENTVLQNLVLRNWDTDDGLPSARINAVLRTSDGYLWIATQKGLARFDGIRFVLFDRRNTPGMNDERVSCLLVDQAGELWVGTSGGALLKREGPGFRAQDLGPGAPTCKVNGLAEDHQGALWLATEGMGLLRFHQGQLQAFSSNCGLPSVNARKVLCDPGGRLWVVAEGQLGYLEQGRWKTPGATALAAQAVRTICQAQDGGLWVATTAAQAGSENPRIYKLKDGQCRAQLQPYPWPVDSQQFQRLALLEDHSGRVWCATAGGLFFWPAAGGWQQLGSDTPWAQLEVMSLAEGEEDLLWIGTRTTGLIQARKRQVTTYPLPRSKNHHAVLTACASRDGSVWCGTDGAGIFRWQNEQFTHFGAEAGLTSLHIAALLEDRQTNLWVGTVDGLFRRVGERFQPASGPAALREPILALLEERQGMLWTGGRAGLVRLDANGGRVFGWEAGLSGTAVRALAQDNQGSIWAGTTDAGLYRLRGERFEFCPVPQEPRLQGICALHADAAGRLWVGTDLAGLLRFQAGRFKQWRWFYDGLPSNHISAILEDDAGELWLGSENGIFGLSKSALEHYRRETTPQLQPRRLTPAEGMVHKVCSGIGQPAACKSADGRLWFPDGPALAVFAPATIPRSFRVWPPVIEGASVDGVPATLPPGGLRVQSGAQRLQIQYTSPNVLASEQLRFRFQLQGLDKEWVHAGGHREASYDRLPPGRYEFKVMVCGRENEWLTAGRGLRLEVVPRFWERPSVQGAAALALVGVMAGGAWTLERSRSRRRLERLELQRALDAERQRIARDIHDDLGSGLTEIILLSDSLGETTQLAPPDQDTAGEISTRARTLTRAMDEVVWAINPRNDTLEGFLTYLGKFTQDYLSRSGLRCRWNVPVEVPELPLSAEVRHSLYLACKEALHNVVKHAAATEVSVRFATDDGRFTLVIADNGQGFAAQDPPPRGNGLSNMRQRLQELRGQCHVESAPGGGTRVSFSLPCPLNHQPV